MGQRGHNRIPFTEYDIDRDPARPAPVPAKSGLEPRHSPGPRSSLRHSPRHGGGTAAQLRKLILELKRRVREEYGIEVEEEVQYVGDFGE